MHDWRLRPHIQPQLVWCLNLRSLVTNANERYWLVCFAETHNESLWTGQAVGHVHCLRTTLTDRDDSRVLDPSGSRNTPLDGKTPRVYGTTVSSANSRVPRSQAVHSVRRPVVLTKSSSAHPPTGRLTQANPRRRLRVRLRGDSRPIFRNRATQAQQTPRAQCFSVFFLSRRSSLMHDV